MPQLKKLSDHWYLTEEEVAEVREQLRKTRERGIYEPGKYYFSSLNRKPEALGLKLPDRMPERVTIRDITLRTAEQTPGCVLTPPERLHIIRALADAGITSYQITRGLMRLNQDQLKSEIKLIKTLVPQAEIQMAAVQTPEDVDYVAECGANCASITGPAIFAESKILGMAVLRQAWEGKDWRKNIQTAKSLAEMVEGNKRLIDQGKKRGVKIQPSMNMILYAQEEDIATFAREMDNAGADYINLHDGPGGMGYHAIAYAVATAKKNAPNTKIGVHLHNTFGLAVALKVAAVQAGAEVLETAVNGMCSALPQADTCQIAATLELLYGVKTGIRLEKLTGLRRLMEDVSRIPVAANHPITGENYFIYNGTDGVVMEQLVDPLVHWCMDPAMFGNKRGWVLDQTSGPWATLEKLTELGIGVDKAEVEEVLKQVRAELLIRKRTLTDDEIRAIAAKVKSAKH